MGIGVTPATTQTLTTQITNGLSLFGNNTAPYGFISNNHVWATGTGDKYLVSGYGASYYKQYSGVHSWATAPAGTANNPITFSERMRIDSSGNVGIGASSLTYKLEVHSTDPAIRLKGTAGFGYIIDQNTSSGFVSHIVYENVGMRFGTNSTERLRIDSSGNVGIGTSAPTLPTSWGRVLHLHSATANGSAIRISDVASGSGDNGLKIGNYAQNTYINNTDTGFIRFDTNGAEAMRISATGAVTKPLQPAFQAIPASNQNNIAIDSVVVVAFGTERFDLGGNYSGNSFSAPVTGKYQFNVNLYLNTIDTAATYYELRFLTSNRTYYHIIVPKFTSDLAYLTLSVSTLADMDASDTAYVALVQSDGTAQTDITVSSFFSGYLVA